MSFSRDALISRHSLALEAIQLPAAFSLNEALEHEQAGNWNLAGEAYSRLDDKVGASLSAEERARLLSRAATCLRLRLDQVQRRGHILMLVVSWGRTTFGRRRQASCTIEPRVSIFSLASSFLQAQVGVPPPRNLAGVVGTGVAHRSQPLPLVRAEALPGLSQCLPRATVMTPEVLVQARQLGIRADGLFDPVLRLVAGKAGPGARERAGPRGTVSSSPNHIAFIRESAARFDLAHPPRKLRSP